MSRGNATLKDLAKKLDVSVATVSKALSGHHRIAPSTRARIETAAREIGYCPNRAARALVSGQTGIVALVRTEQARRSSDGAGGRFIEELSRALSRQGIDLLMTSVAEGASELEAVEKIVRARKADGLVLTDLRPNDPRLAFMMHSEFPFVVYGHPGEILPGHARSAPNWVASNGEAAAARAVHVLRSLGHRRFGLVRGDVETSFALRWSLGAKRAVRAGLGALGTIDTLRLPAPAPAADREAALCGLLGRGTRPTAILADDDMLALAVIEAAEELGLDVPRDLTVVGFGNAPAAAHRKPGLTTFDPAIARCADLLADVMRTALAKDRTRHDPVHRSLTPEMILRGTHGPAPRSTRLAKERAADLHPENA